MSEAIGARREIPFWWEDAPRPAPSGASLPESVDVAVVGSGYAGLSAALTLSREGRSVLVLERLRAGEGASSRNGGICSGNIRARFSALLDTLGTQGARRVYAEGVEARNYLRSLIERERIDCDFAPVGRFTGACTPDHYERLAREADLIRKHLGLDVYPVPRSEQHQEIGSDFYHGGEVREDIAGFHPGRFHLGLLERALSAGARLADETEVQGVRHERGGFDVATSRGRVRAREVIGATNGYTTTALPWLRRRVIPVPSRIVVTAPIGNNVMARLSPKRRMHGETRRLYHYYRPTPDGTRLLFGGRGGGEDASGRKDAEILRGEMVRRFPELEDVEITHSWHGYTGFTRDMLPHVGVRDGIHYVAGFCGSGTVWATWLGHQAALRLLQSPRAGTAFAGAPFRAFPPYRSRPWFLPPALLWHRLCDRLGR